MMTETMRIWYDTEFIEDGSARPIIPISIGMVAEDGRELYREFGDRIFEVDDHSLWSTWHRENLIPYLEYFKEPTASPLEAVRDTTEIRDDILDFVGDARPQWVGYYADYDHVVLSQIFGTMIGLPKGWPMWTFDLKQWAYTLGDPRLPKQVSTEHHALADARHNRDMWHFLASC